MKQALQQTHYHFKGQSKFYRGKVRDVYFFDDIIAVVATDRISAFDIVFPRAIPGKGACLNQIAAYQLEITKDIVPNWAYSFPDPNLTIGHLCKPFPIEMIVRGYLAGHAWRLYQSGSRLICGIKLPEGLKENDPLPLPIVTPTTKAISGHDEDITPKAIIEQKLITATTYEELEHYALTLYQKGVDIATQRGLILVDTKYEFGERNNVIHLIDEIHTPDSSRYFYMEFYNEMQEKELPQKHLSKEFVRQWSIDNNFQGKAEQNIPLMTDEVVANITERYKELYQTMMGKALPILPYDNIIERIEQNIIHSLQI